MIGTNHDLESIQRVLDCRILELKQLASAAPDQAWVSGQLATLGRERITVSAILVHRRIEAAKKIVDLAGGLLETAHSPAALLRERGRPDPGTGLTAVAFSKSSAAGLILSSHTRQRSDRSASDLVD
jgi:hypothetical protein